MIPAPAQGAIMITALEEDEETRAICAEINHEETEICTNIEREFLNFRRWMYCSNWCFGLY